MFDCLRYADVNAIIAISSYDDRLTLWTMSFSSAFTIIVMLFDFHVLQTLTLLLHIVWDGFTAFRMDYNNVNA